MTFNEDVRPWQQHTGRFLPRALAVGSTSFEFLHPHIDALPRAPFDVELSDQGAVRYQLALVVIASLRSAREIALSSSKLWVQGHFLLAAVGFRMLLELDGQLLWAQKMVLASLDAGEVEVAFGRIKKLLLGTKSPIPLIRGEIGPHPLVNVMDFVRSAEAVRAGASDDYAFLCDSAHPSFMMHSWMLFAGPDHDNWTNATFAAEVAPLLDRVLRIAETSLGGIADAAETIMTAVVPAIRSEFA